MPWWIWLVLALFMLAMIAAGVVYAVRHAMAALDTVSPLMDRFGEAMGRMGEDGPDDGRAFDGPAFARPISESADRYAEAHARVVERAEARRARRMAVWARWARFGEDPVRPNAGGAGTDGTR